MNKSNRPEPDPENLLKLTLKLKRALKDDLPPEVETRMNRQFLSLKSSLDREERMPESNGWLWMRVPFRKEILAVAAAAMIILGLLMQFNASQTALAHSIEQLKVIVTISMSLNRVAFMDCTVLNPDTESEQTSYRVRWRAPNNVRVDMDSADGARTLWISNETISIAEPSGSDVRSMSIHTMTPGPVWQPALEFISPETVAKHMEEHYGLMQSSGRSGAGANEFLIAGREGSHDVEITVDKKTYLPKLIRKYSHASGRTNEARTCIMVARFHWNQPMPTELFNPQTPEIAKSGNPDSAQP